MAGRTSFSLIGQRHPKVMEGSVLQPSFTFLITITPAIMSLFLIRFPVCLIWIFMDKILVVIGQDPEIAKVAWRYALWLIPALFAYVILQSQVRYFQTQSLISSDVVCVTGNSVLPSIYLFVGFWCSNPD